MNIVTTTSDVPSGAVRLAKHWSSDGVLWHYFTDYDLTILLRNLAVAGALCAAWIDGWKSRDDFGCSRSWPDGYWHPGCGREVPR